MRKWLALLLAAAFLFTGAAAETEQAQQVYIAGKGISVFVPAGFMVVQREGEALDSRLTDIGMTREMMDYYMEQSNAYLCLFRPDFLYEIDMFIADFDAIENLAAFDDDTIASLMFSFAGQYENAGLTVAAKGIGRINDTALIFFLINRDSAQELRYITIVDRQMIVLALTDHTGEVTEEEEAVLRQITEMSDFRKHE